MPSASNTFEQWTCVHNIIVVTMAMLKNVDKREASPSNEQSQQNIEEAQK